MRFHVGIAPIQAMQRHALGMLKESDGRHFLGSQIRDTTFRGVRYAQAFTHVDTGALRSSHIPSFSASMTNAEGKIFIAPGQKNPRHGRYTDRYGVIEHDRGGSHSFYRLTYDRLVDERSSDLIAQRLIRRYDSY